MKPAFFTGLLMAFLGAALAVASLVWLPHCGGAPVMKCVWMVRATAGVGFMIMLGGIIMQFVSAHWAAGLQTANILNGILVILLATVLIGPCPNPMMGCHATTQGALIVFGVIIALIAAADLWRLSRRG